MVALYLAFIMIVCVALGELLDDLNPREKRKETNEKT